MHPPLHLEICPYKRRAILTLSNHPGKATGFMGVKGNPEFQPDTQ
jgi:hypothetical protein